MHTLKKREKILTQQLKDSDTPSPRFLLEYAMIQYYRGMKRGALKYIEQAFASTWIKAERADIIYHICGKMLEILPLEQWIELFESKKSVEFGSHLAGRFFLIYAPWWYYSQGYSAAELQPTLPESNEGTTEESDGKSDGDTAQSVTTSKRDIEELVAVLAELTHPGLLRLGLALLIRLKLAEGESSNEVDSLFDRWEESRRQSAFTLDEQLLFMELTFANTKHFSQLKAIQRKLDKLLDSLESPLVRARAHLLMSLIYEQREQLVDAIRSAESGLRFAQHYYCKLNVALRLRLARLYLEVGLYKASLKVLEEALGNPHLTADEVRNIRFAQIDVFQRRRMFNEASRVGAYLLDREQDPYSRQTILLKMAAFFHGQCQLTTAKSYIDSIDEQLLDPSSIPQLYFIKSSIVAEEGQTEQAIDFLEQALSLSTDREFKTKVRLQLSKYYRRSGRIEEVVRTLKEVKSEETTEAQQEEAQSEMQMLRDELEKDSFDDVVTLSKKTKLLEEIEEEIGERSLFERLSVGLGKTRAKLVDKIEQIVKSGAISEDMLDEVEETLILSDVGFETTTLIVNRLRKAYTEKKITAAEQITPFLIEEISTILTKYEGTISTVEKKPLVLMIVGVNGVGKTTTIAKLTYQFQREGKSVILAAADTFRAGAIEQISEWGRRLDVEVIKHQSGSDPSAVAYDAVHAAVARERDVLIIDTAGRLHTKVNLMEELKKVRRIVERELPGAPHEILLVLDSTNGQNAISQAKIFSQDLDVSGIVMTKLDGTAKGGIIISIVQELNIPVKYIGIGEKMYDLRPFNARDFVEALFGVQRD